MRQQRRSTARPDHRPQRRAALPARDELPLVVPQHAVPPGPVGYALHAPELLLHAAVSDAAWEILRRDGRLTGPSVELVDPLFRDGYRWLRERMVTPCEPGRFPLWAWARIRRRDLVLNAPGEAERIWLTLRVPRQRVTLLRSDEWVIGPLMQQGFVRPDPGAHRHAKFDERAFDRAGDRLDRVEAALSPADRERRTAGSWEAVLAPSLNGRGYVEAVFPHLLAEEVVDAVRLEPRPAGPTSSVTGFVTGDSVHS